MNATPTRSASAPANRRSAGKPSFAESVRGWWAGLQAREQQGLILGVTVLALAALWLLAVQPAWQLLRQAPTRLATLDAQTLTMQRLAAEAKGLRGSPQVTPAQSAVALRDASARLGSVAKLSIQGDRATLTVEGLSADDLRAWLAEVRGGARARAVEAQLTRGPTGFSGSITLALAPGTAP
jgi:general secretion pathway protein M